MPCDGSTFSHVFIVLRSAAGGDHPSLTAVLQEAVVGEGVGPEARPALDLQEGPHIVPGGRGEAWAPADLRCSQEVAHMGSDDLAGGTCRGQGGGLGKQKESNYSMAEFSGGGWAIQQCWGKQFPLEAGHSGLGGRK